MSALLRCEGVSVAYRTRSGEVAALDGVDLTVGAGEAVGVIGASGSGKSTLALAIVRYLGAGRIAGGRVLFEGRDIAALDAEALRAVRGRGIGLVFQDPQAALDPTMRLGAQIAEAAVLHGMGAAEAHAAAIRALATMRIDDPERVANAYPHQVSGGQQQRAVIAMALLAEPKLLILDEPTSALDANVAADILDALKAEAETRGMAILLISHDLGAVRRLCTRVEVLENGRRVAGGSVTDILDNPRHPAARALADAWRGPPPADARPRDWPPLLRIDGLGKTYAGGVEALKDVSLTLGAGEVLAVIGESGAGKTTLGAVVAGLETATGGSVRLSGVDVARLPARRRPAGVLGALRMVFQNPAETLNPAHTVRRQLARALVRAGEAATSDRLGGLLTAVGLDETFLERRPGQLSGGEQQRVAIARALAGAPALIVADEPTSALDPVVRNAVLATFRAVQAASGAAVLFITHDIAAARAVADTVAVMKDGEIVEIGSTADVFFRPGSNYTTNLLSVGAEIEPIELPGLPKLP